MFTYDAFGLDIDSAVRLPVLGDRTRSGTTQSVQRTAVEVGEASIPGQSSLTASTATLLAREPGSFDVYREDGDLYWFFESAGRLHVSDGRRIDVDLDATADEATRQHLVLGPGIYSTLVQRERPALHASAVVVDDVAVAFSGATGRGKSTAAAACYAAGHGVLADDVTAVLVADDRPRVAPGAGRLRIAPEAASALGLETDGPGATAEERTVDVSNGARESAVPLAIVYVLEDAGGSPTSVELDPRVGLFELLQTSYLLAADDEDASRLAAQQRSAARIASGVEVRRLSRPDDLERLGGLVEQVEADVENLEDVRAG